MSARRHLAVLGVGALALGPPAAALAAPAPQPPPGSLHLAAFTAPPSLTAGERAAVGGRVAPAGVVTVRIQALAGAEWRAIATLRTDARGRFAAALPLTRSVSLRALVETAAGPAVSRRRNVALRRGLTLRVRATEYEAIAGRPLAVSGTVSGARAGERVLLEGLRDGGAYRPLGRPRVRGGAVRATIAAPAGGVWRLRLTAAPGPGVDAGRSATAPPLRLHGRNPHGVPASSSRHIVQDVGEMQLYYYEAGALRRVLPVVFGAPSTPTPLGRWRVYSTTVGPGPAFGPLAIWYHRGYGIHGTNQEYLLSRSWRYYSHGCTRNYNRNIRWLWPRVPVGTPVVNIA